jgi:hypothetical protein
LKNNLELALRNIVVLSFTFFNMAESEDMNIDSDMDIALLDDLSQIEFEPPPVKVTDKGWANWTEEEKTQLFAYSNYYQAAFEYITHCWAHGPSGKDNFPKEPEGDIDIRKLVFKKKRKQKAKLVSKTKTKKISDDDFDQSLRKKICETKEMIAVPVVTDELNLEEGSKRLQTKDYNLRIGETKNLQAHIEFGKDLNKVKELFDSQKSIHKLKWEKWISETVNLSIRYVSKHRTIATLVEKYPQLEKLSITFSELYSMKKKLNDMFARNVTIANWWKSK